MVPFVLKALRKAGLCDGLEEAFGQENALITSKQICQILGIE